MKKPADTSVETSAKIVFRVFPQGEKVYLMFDSVNGKKTDIETRVEVVRPVTRESLDNAQSELGGKVPEEAKKTPPKDNESSLRQEIDAALAPDKPDSFLLRAKQASGAVLIVLFQTLFGMILVSLPYKGVQYSNESFPGWLQIVILSLYTLFLGLGLWLIATERNRWKISEKIVEWFGPRGLVIYPGILLVTSAAVFASFTFILFENEAIELQRQNTAPISVAVLIDFYMWHFLKLIPLLKINEVLKWAEPAIYTQSRVGFLILLFQALVVIPTISTVRFYWKNRFALDGKKIGYIAGLEPDSS